MQWTLRQCRQWTLAGALRKLPWGALGWAQRPLSRGEPRVGLCAVLA